MKKAKPSPATMARTRASTLTKRCSMAGNHRPSALAFGVMSEKGLTALAVSAVGFVAPRSRPHAEARGFQTP